MNQLEMNYFNDLLTSIIRDQDQTNPIIIGIAGNVAVGKSTFAAKLKCYLEQQLPDQNVAVVCTDCFLYSNQTLRRRHLMPRKGFPESYNYQQLLQFMTAVRSRQCITVPVYDHRTNDVSNQRLSIDKPDVLIIEGLMALQAPLVALTDYRLFLECDVDVVFGWYLRRGQQLQNDQSVDVPRMANLWQTVNAPNYEMYVLPTKKNADMVLQLNFQHQVVALEKQSSHEEVLKHAIYN